MEINFDKFVTNEVKMSRVAKNVTFDGYLIYIGKNAKMNDILTFDIAEPNDIWLHASGVPGSHVVIKLNGKEYPPKDVIKKAAELAAKNSRASGKTKVVYTEAKNVSKSKEHNDGQVNVNYNKSKIITVYKND